MITVEQINTLSEVRFLFDHWTGCSYKETEEAYCATSVFRHAINGDYWVGEHNDCRLGHFTSDLDNDDLARTVSDYFKWLEDDYGAPWTGVGLTMSAELKDDILVFKVYHPDMKRNVTA